jgi:predicted O-linked N-acetylglucosamine transferase (SPINDLY family)
MGAIKDIVDLAKDLESRAKDRRDMDIIHKIQALAFSFQSNYTDIVERDVRLVQENADLKKQLAESQAEEVRVHRTVEFRRGKRTGGKWMAFCPKCGLPAAEGTEYNAPIVYCTSKYDDCGWRAYPKMLLAQILQELET